MLRLAKVLPMTAPMMAPTRRMPPISRDPRAHPSPQQLWSRGARTGLASRAPHSGTLDGGTPVRSAMLFCTLRFACHALNDICQPLAVSHGDQLTNLSPLNTRAPHSLALCKTSLFHIHCTGSGWWHSERGAAHALFKGPTGGDGSSPLPRRGPRIDLRNALARVETRKGASAHTHNTHDGKLGVLAAVLARRAHRWTRCLAGRGTRVPNRQKWCTPYPQLARTPPKLRSPHTQRTSTLSSLD